MSIGSLLRKERGRTNWAEEANLGARSAKGTIVIASGSWFRFVMQFASTIVLARILGPEEYGVAAIVLAVAAASAIVRESGFFTLSAQRPNLPSMIATSFHYVSIACGLVGALILLGVGPLMALAFDDDRYLLYAALLSPTVALAGLAAVPAAILARNIMSGRSAALEVVATAVSVAAGIGLALGGWGAQAMVLQALILSAGQTFLTLLLCPWAPERTFSWRATRIALPAVVSLTSVQILNYATANLDRILVGFVFGVRAAGFYSQAMQLLLIPLHLIGSPLQRVFVPTLSRVRKQPVRYQRYVTIVLIVMTGMLWPMFGILAVYIHDIVILVFGFHWAPTAPIFPALVLSGYAQAVGFVITWVMVSSGQFRNQLRLSVLGKVLMLLGYFIGTQWGVVGVGAAGSICAAMMLVPSYIVARGVPQLRWQNLYRPLLWPSVLTALAVGVGVIIEFTFPEGAHPSVVILKLVLALAMTVLIATLVPSVRAQMTTAAGMLRPSKLEDK